METKKLVQEMEIKLIPRHLMDYPNPDNPRITGLGPTDPEILELAKSIKNNGLLYPPIVICKPDGRYQGIDGDRRCVAVFDVLKWTDIPARIAVDLSKLDMSYLRMICNWDRRDLNRLEKGAYIWAILREEMSKEGVDIDSSWGRRETRSKFTKTVANRLGKPVTAIITYLNLYRQIPAEDREIIATSRAELNMDHKLSADMAIKVLALGRKLGDVKGIWRSVVPEGSVARKDKVSVSIKKMDLARKQILAGEMSSVDDFKEFMSSGKESEWRQKSLLLTVEEVKSAAQLASALKTDVFNIYRGGIYLGAKYQDELLKIIMEKL